jgi:hypothetical protein
MKRLAGNPTALWSAFVIAHLWLGFLNLTAPGLPLGDVTLVYKFWAEQADYANYYVGIDGVWVYPVLALVPMVVAAVFGFASYASTWLSLIFVLDVVAFAALVGWRRPPRVMAVGWWWVAFLLLLGPIALGRIDSITVPVAVVAVLFIARRPRVASVLLTLAAWIKVWPVAIVAAVVIASRERRRVLVAAVITSALIIGTALALGSGANVFSFISQQTGRGLQVEAPISTVWMWMSYAHVPGAFPYYSQQILTYQVNGPGAPLAATLMTPVLVLAFAAVALLGVLAVRRSAPVPEVLPSLSLAFITAFIAFNKVGSPQYMTWLTVPVVLGLATAATGHGRSFTTPALLALVTGGLTQLFYPYLYVNLLELHPFLLADLTARNLLVVVLFGWSIRELWRLSRRSTQHEELVDAGSWLPTLWPFERTGSHLGRAGAAELDTDARDDRGMLDERFPEGR